MSPARGRYETRLGPESWDYIDAVNRWFPPEIAQRPIAGQREVYDAMCRAFHAGRPANVRVEDGVFPSPAGPVPIRRYTTPATAPSPVVLYFHGGGFCLGGLDSHDDICAEICAGADLEVVSVDYRLAPEHLHPAAFLDAVAAFRWLGGRGVPVLLCGESAGGNLAAAVSHAMRGDPCLLGQVLIYPGLGGELQGGSYAEHADAPLLSTADVKAYQTLRTGGTAQPDDPTLSPLRDTDFSGLPPTVIVTAECDPLSDDGRDYGARLKEAGGRALWRKEARLTHSFLRSRRTVRRAREAFNAIIADVAALAAGRWPG